MPQPQIVTNVSDAQCKQLSLNPNTQKGHLRLCTVNDDRSSSDYVASTRSGIDTCTFNNLLSFQSLDKFHDFQGPHTIIEKPRNALMTSK